MILPIFRLLTDSLEETPFANRTRMRQARYRLNLAKQCAASARVETRMAGEPDDGSRSEV